MSILRSRWLLPVAGPPIHNGWVEVADGRILSIGRGRPPAGAVEDLGDAALLPGLVNAHTHLELSWLEGRVPRAARMTDWIRAIVRERLTGVPGGAEAEERAVRAAAASMLATGTVLVGDVSNALTTPRVLQDVGLGGVVFHELLGFAAADPAGLVRDAWARIDALGAPRNPGTAEPRNPGTSEPRNLGTPEPRNHLSFSVTAHSPYSVSPALFAEIVRRASPAPRSIHLAESVEEVEFLRTGRGPIRDLLEDLGVWTDAWPVPGCDPVEYVTRLGYLVPGTLVVHGVHLTDEGLAALRKAGGVLVACPRSNGWVGSGVPPLSRAYRAGVPVAVGTDSLASSPSLNMFDELAAMRRAAPDVAPARLVESATRVGAEALGFASDYGTIEPGKRAALVAVRIPAAVTDVEEYVVSGVPAAAIQPIA